MNKEEPQLKDYKRIAVMGGTFDPIHYGHLVAAEAVRHEYGIERVLFIPTGKPPHKKGREISPNEQRYLMTVLATATNPYFDTLRIEIDREGYTYTIDTVKELRKICRKDVEIYFITGADAVHEILTWKDVPELLGLCSFIAVTRPGCDTNTLFNDIDEIKKNFISRLHFLEVPALAISSSDIRRRVRNKQPIKYLLPEPVCEYIYKYSLYADKEIIREVRTMLSEKRYTHTQGVIEEAAKLSALYGVDSEKAQTAALLHDIAKDISNSDKKKLCKEYDIKTDEIMKEKPDLLHSFLGAEIAKRKFDIKDEEILDAIRYHTLGRPDMTLLEKIIYTADFIEPNRKPFNGLEEVRKLAYKNLDEAVAAAIEHTIKYNESGIVHPLSIKALKFIKETLN